ncbi:MAG: serine/threonine protein kinase [Proteobacteria bacterium]|nr:MAG: serine/threonine protein kinase [Pseudomonadota bacterium]PIE18076.1 MAG: serine/threonine protein kinase [Pseudomonadota bacterium]
MSAVDERREELGDVLPTADSLGQLSHDLAQKARSRLATVALGLAGAHVLSLGLDLVNHLLGFGAAPNQRGKNAISAALILLSLALALTCARRLRMPSWLPSVYHVFAALGIELSAQLTPWPIAAAVPYQLMRTVSWVALWIVIFPLFVPAPPRRAAITALVAALMGPTALGMTILLGNPWPGIAVALSVHLPTLVAAGIAVIGARIIFGLERRASARRRLGSYLLERRLAVGGMGEIWLGEHQLLGRPAAIKLIAARDGDDPAQGELRRRRFEREAKATASLCSPHTVRLYDFGIDEGTFYYVMELCKGLDLEQLVLREGVQPPGRVIKLLRQVCASLGEAHERGLLHRDIKPSNIMLSSSGDEGEVKVLDFGLVLAFGPASDDESRLTHDEALRGTPNYTAPEIALDEPPIDGRADLYSLGCVAYWLITGQRPFERSTPLKTLLAHVRDAPRPPSELVEVPAELEAVVLRCLEKTPIARFPNASALDEALASCGVDGAQ